MNFDEKCKRNGSFEEETDGNYGLEKSPGLVDTNMNFSIDRIKVEVPDRQEEENTLLQDVNKALLDSKSTILSSQQYRCTVCKLIYRSESSLRDHMVLHEEAKTRFLCDQCGKEFKNKYFLLNHLKAHSFKGNKDLIECGKCGRVFPSKISLAHHELVHRKGNQFRCSECGQTFIRKYLLDCHKLSHIGKLPYSCNVCGVEFAYKNLLDNHARRHTGKLFKCKICGKEMKSKGNLKVHSLIHSNEKKFKCHICSRTFNASTSYVDHINTHNSTMSFECKICNTSYSSRKGLKNHMIRHTGNHFKFSCSLCNQKFVHKGRFVQHKETHMAENSWKFITCGEIFSKRGLLLSHKSKNYCKSRETHTNKCEFCDHVFTESWRLKLHKQVHIAKTSWKCPDCGEIFQDKNMLSNHRKTCDAKEKISYNCKFCDSSFSRKRMLTHHNKVHISLNEWKCVACSDIFSDRKFYQKHRRKCAGVIDSFHKCELCKATFSKVRYYKAHCEIHMAENEWKCVACSQIFSDKKLLNKHKRECSPVKEFSFKCEFCDGTCSNLQDFQLHQKIHISSNCWKCLVCNKIYPDMAWLSAHRKEIHKKA